MWKRCSRDRHHLKTTAGAVTINGKLGLSASYTAAAGGLRQIDCCCPERHKTSSTGVTATAKTEINVGMDAGSYLFALVGDNTGAGAAATVSFSVTKPSQTR